MGVGMDADPSRLLLTSGAHNALWVAFSLLSSNGGPVFTEQHTYPGAIALSRLTGCRLIGLPMDQEGIVPVALDEASSAESGPKTFYVTPIIQNPTTSTMSRTRREEIVEICQRRDIIIIEDDVYRLGPNASLPPLATLAPERTLYVNSMSKTVNPALRVGALIVPEGGIRLCIGAPTFAELTSGLGSIANLRRSQLQASSSSLSSSRYE
jgi:DNA-binding transcriptional MocR family regulator